MIINPSHVSRVFDDPLSSRGQLNNAVISRVGIGLGRWDVCDMIIAAISPISDDDQAIHDYFLTCEEPA